MASKNAAGDASPGVAVVKGGEWVRAALIDGVLPVEESSGDTAQKIVAEILSSETVDDVIGSSDPLHAKDLIGQPLTIHGGVFRRSEYEEGTGIYAVADCTHLGTGERVKVTMGASNIVAQLYRIAELGGFPVSVKIVESKRPTPDGYRPQRLVSI